MSFPKAPIKRFNEASTCAPPPGSYDVKSSDPSKGPVSFEKSQRFRKETDDLGCQQNPGSMKRPPSPPAIRKQPTLDSKRSNSGMRAEKDLLAMKDLRTRKEMEKEIRVLIGERGQQDKKLQALEEELAKAESKLCAAVREKTSLFASIASLEKQLLELNRTNELLKSKFSDDGTDKKMRSLWLELMKLRSLKVKTSVVKHEDMEAKLHAVPKNLKHSKEKITQLEEQLTTENQAEEKCDPDNILEYIAELGNVARQVDKYKQDIDQLEAMIESKNKEIETMQCTFQMKEAMLSAEIKELHEKCKLLDQEKEQCKTACEEKQQIANDKIEQLKDKLTQEEKEHQKEKEICKEMAAAMHQKLLEFQKEMCGEKELLEKELRETMDELDKLHTKEEKVDKLLKQLQQENKSQAEKLVLVEAKLKRKSAELVTAAEAHNDVIAKMEEKHSNTLSKLGETIAEFEIYKASVTEEITGLQHERTTLQNKLLELNKTVQQVTKARQELQHAKDKINEECARMLLDAQTKVALKETELKSIKDSSAVQIANLQRKLQEQSEDFKKRLEIERRTIAEKVETECRESLENWRALYEDLYNKVKPFQQQLDAYQAEKNALLNEKGAAQEELNKLSDAYAKLLGHQNLKQKIKHVVKLKEENAQLKQEVSKLRTQLIREKAAQGELQEEINKIQGVKRFDPSKAFQHSAKENIDPKTPFKESDRNKNQGAIS